MAGLQDEYYLYAILPTLRVPEPVTCGPMVFCTTHHLDRFRFQPQSDELSIRSLLTRFRDSFGTPLECLGLELVPEAQADELGSQGLPRAARDLLALSYLTEGAKRNCGLQQRFCVFEADFFDILPIRFRNEGFVIDRPGLIGINATMEGFNPTLRADIHHPREDEFALDRRLLDACSRQLGCIRRGEHEKEIRQILHAVAIAVGATRIVHLMDATNYDLAPRVVAWISAFETLLHPGTGRVGLNHVLKLCSSINWEDSGRQAREEQRLNAKIHDFKNKNGITETEDSIANYYRRLYQLRNDLAHGNAIDRNDFHASAIIQNGCRIDEVAILLFRECVLERLREFGIIEPIPAVSKAFDDFNDDDFDDFKESVKNRIDAGGFHDALAHALLGPPEDET